MTELLFDMFFAVAIVVGFMLLIFAVEGIINLFSWLSLVFGNIAERKEMQRRAECGMRHRLQQVFNDKGASR